MHIVHYNTYTSIVQPRLDGNLYQYTLPFNIYYFVVQPIAGR